MAKKAVALPTIANNIYELLEKLQPADRLKAINAALTLLGDELMSGASSKGKKKEHTDFGVGDDHHDTGSADLSTKGRAWMRKYKVSGDQLSDIFDLDGESIEVIADDVPGGSSKLKTINAYVLTGIGQYLKTGDVKFTDQAARTVCKHIGCLNAANHSTYMGAKGNLFTGTKKTGWKLTAPGLKKGAELIAAIADNGE